jgi:hypothetical protein
MMITAVANIGHDDVIAFLCEAQQDGFTESAMSARARANHNFLCVFVHDGSFVEAAVRCGFVVYADLFAMGCRTSVAYCPPND